MKNLKIIFGLIISIILLRQNFINAQQKINWNGYIQYRFTDNYLNQTDFSLRRAKFWVDGMLPLSSNEWGYKVQAAFYNKQNFLFQLQDAFITYTDDKFKLTAGQFVPDFSLQRKQSDYSIPLTERANAINALMPSSETMGRDIGIELSFKTNTAGLSAGFFNGNGANTASAKRNFLYFNRGYLHVKNTSNEFQIGYSVSFRKDNELKFSNLLGSTAVFSGRDFRYGFDARIKLNRFEFQTEYLEAHLENEKAGGYYALADYKFTENNLAVLSIDQLNDLNSLTSNKPWYTIGLVHYINGDYIKLSLDNKFQFLNNKTNVLTVLQVQYFFNQE